MITTDLMNTFQALEYRSGYLNQFFFGKSFILSGLKQVEKRTIRTVLHQNNPDFILYISVSQSYKLSSITGYYIFRFWKF